MALEFLVHDIIIRKPCCLPQHALALGGQDKPAFDTGIVLHQALIIQRLYLFTGFAVGADWRKHHPPVYQLQDNQQLVGSFIGDRLRRPPG